MIFEALQTSNEAGELMLLDGAFCRFHVRRDGQLTISEIISQCPGMGKEILYRLHLKAIATGCNSIFAKCPADLPANAWYERRGFVLEDTQTTRTGRVIQCWRLRL